MATFELSLHDGSTQSVDAASLAALQTTLNDTPQFATLVADPGGENVSVNTKLVLKAAPVSVHAPN